MKSHTCYKNSDIIRNSPKSQNNWATFARQFVAKNLKNRPIWSHCLGKAFNV